MRVIHEEERIEAIKQHIEGERPVEIYRSLGKSKPWFMKWWKRYRTGNEGWYIERSSLDSVGNFRCIILIAGLAFYGLFNSKFF